MKKTIEAGVPAKNPKAPNKKGNFIKVQNRTLGKMKKGGKVKSKKGK